MQTLMVLGLLFAVSCSKDDDPSDPNTSVPDPQGTVLVSMRNANNGSTQVTPDGCDNSFRIGNDDNFEGVYSGRYQFVTIGPMKGLGNVTQIPSSGWAAKVAVRPGYGYVAQCQSSKTCVRIYVENYIESVSGGVIGADVKYQSPFETLSVSTDALSFTKEQGSKSITVTTNVLGWTHSCNASWITCVKNNNTLSVSVSANTGIPRSEIIVIQAGKKREEIVVMQAAGLAATSAPYAIGDLYNENGVTGIVYQVTAGGMRGMIVSATETACAWSTEFVVTGATDMANGMNNMNKIKAIAGWESKYPAFKWCNDFNTGSISGWYLPARDELNNLYTNHTVVNATLTQYGGAQISGTYWSSSEGNYDDAWSQDFGSGYQYISTKYYYYSNSRVRAVRAF